MGERMLAGALRSQELWIQRQRLCESIMRVDPLGRILRRFQVMRRRVHKVEGPNALWHVESIFPLTDMENLVRNDQVARCEWFNERPTFFLTYPS